METQILGYQNQIFNENSYSQNFSTSQPRPRSNSAPQERILNSTSNSNINNRTIEQLQQRRNARSCHCGLEPVLREVKVNTVNKGRFFWSCRKFGGPNHKRRCNFFKWENTLPTQNTNVIAMVTESPSTIQNTSETPHDDNLETPYYTPHNFETPDTNDTNINNYNDGDDGDDDDGDDNDDNNVNDGEVNLSPLPDQLTGNRVTTRIIATPLRRSRASLSQAPSITTNRTIRTTAAADSNETSATGDVYTRKPFLFSNWSSVPRYSTPGILDIFQNHLVQQDKNHQQWYNAAQLAKKDYEEAKKEVEKLMKELEIVNRENMLCKRENDVLKAEKRLLEMENSELKGENQEMKRRH